MTAALRFLHLADLHLGLRITRFGADAAQRLQEARLQALERTRLIADETRPDFVVVAGDLFDDASVDAATARRAYDLLLELRLPVYVIPGNHDPLQPGGVWDREPWRSARGDVQICARREPVPAPRGATLFPCPVFRKTSYDNPTQWIADHARASGERFRIAAAHGSVTKRPGQYEDDHPISPTAFADLDLDYVALGHWHLPEEFKDAAGNVRMAYPGVPEPMRFPCEADSLGWQPYVSEMDREEFRDGTGGQLLLVTFDQPGSPPGVVARPTGSLVWTHWQERLEAEADLDQILRRLSDLPDPARRVFRLTVRGRLPLPVMARMQELRALLGRFAANDLEEGDLEIEPLSEEIAELVGTGVLARVHARLAAEQQSNDESTRETASRALMLLYEIARELHPVSGSPR